MLDFEIGVKCEITHILVLQIKKLYYCHLATKVHSIQVILFAEVFRRFEIPLQNYIALYTSVVHLLMHIHRLVLRPRRHLNQSPIVITSNNYCSKKDNPAIFKPQLRVMSKPLPVNPITPLDHKKAPSLSVSCISIPGTNDCANGYLYTLLFYCRYELWHVTQ